MKIALTHNEPEIVNRDAPTVSDWQKGLRECIVELVTQRSDCLETNDIELLRREINQVAVEIQC